MAYGQHFSINLPGFCGVVPVDGSAGSSPSAGGLVKIGPDHEGPQDPDENINEEEDGMRACTLLNSTK